MTTIDIVILIILAIGGISGFSRGFFKVLATIAGLIIGLIVAKALYISLAEEVAPLIRTSVDVARILSFILIWLLVPLGFSIIAGVLTRAFKAIYLGWLNRLAGVLVGIIKYVFILGLLINVLDYLDTENKLIDKTKKQESLLYYPVKDFIKEIFFPAGHDKKDSDSPKGDYQIT